MKKVLYCASTLSHIEQFHLPYLRAFREQGFEVWVVANESRPVMYADRVLALSLRKNLPSYHNILAIIAVWKLLRSTKFDIVSTHTALAAAVVRAAILLFNKNKRPFVFNTCHGYLFNQNDGFKKWLYLLPEIICSPVTDVLMVMNHEDYAISERYKLYKKKLYYICGMGIDLSKFKPASQEERQSARIERNLSEKDFVFLYAAEFSKRKNQAFLIRAFANICKGYPDMRLLLAGDGKLLNECRSLACQLNVSDQIIFLGFVKEMKQLYAASDICVTSSRIEGLPFNVMEAIACGLPVIASNIKGHNDLIKDSLNGWLFEQDQLVQLEEKLVQAYHNSAMREICKQNNPQRIQQFGLNPASQKIMGIYGLNPNES